MANLTFGGDDNDDHRDEPSLLYNIKTSASSSQRFLQSALDERHIVKPPHESGLWLISALTKSMTDNLDQITVHEMFYVQDATNFLTEHRTTSIDNPDSIGISRAVNYGHTYDPDETALDSVFMQYLTLDDKSQSEIVLISQDGITHTIEEHCLVDLKTNPVDKILT